MTPPPKTVTLRLSCQQIQALLDAADDITLQAPTPASVDLVEATSILRHAITQSSGDELDTAALRACYEVTRGLTLAVATNEGISGDEHRKMARLVWSTVSKIDPRPDDPAGPPDLRIVE